MGDGCSDEEVHGGEKVKVNKANFLVGKASKPSAGARILWALKF